MQIYRCELLMELLKLINIACLDICFSLFKEPEI